MNDKEIKEALNGFFRFYEDGFQETRPAYEKIIDAFVETGVLEEGVTVDSVIEECKKIDAAEVVRTGGKVKEANIGLQGYFASVGISKTEMKDDTKAKAMYEKMGLDSSNLPQKAEDRLKAINMAMGEKALNALIESEKNNENKEKSTIEAKAFLGSLAAGPYFPRQTCFSASHFMSQGSIMQIGCSQGKTSVVAMTTYEQLMAGKKVFSTSSAPGLVPENYNEARAFYERMGIANEFCSISQNETTNEDHIVLFNREKDDKGNELGKSTKYEIRKTEEGIKVFEEKIKKVEKDGKIKKIRKMEEVSPTKELIDKLGLKQTKDGKIDFEQSIKEMMDKKGIIMGDTITLGKYQDLMPEKNPDTHTIPNTALIVDEADAEILDTQPQEILGEKYTDEEANKRWKMRQLAKDKISNLIAEKGVGNITKEDLEGLVKDGVTLDFIVDAYEATKFFEKNSATDEFQYEEKDGKIFILNPNTNVMIPASQGLSQAIIANDEELSIRHSEFKEKEVLGETDIPKLFSNFSLVSLMSGTMQDKGMSEEQVKGEYSARRSEFFSACCNALAIAAEKGVIDWKLVTPKTREEKGNVIVTTKGVKYNDPQNIKNNEKELTTIGEKVTDWRTYIENNHDTLESKWREAVKSEAERRSNAGQPVMVSVYGDRNPMDKDVPIYTAQNQIATDKDKYHKIGDDKCLFSIDGKGEIACFDDFYGRGYTFKFLKRDKEGNLVKNKDNKNEKFENGGHVLISSLPQNSRNLEQFLFRVARGGDKGSSSMIISPTDPVLIGYLERLEEEKGADIANSYFQEIISGTRSVDEIVTDIYPEETKAIFEEKLSQLEMREIYTDTIKQTTEYINAIQKSGKVENKELSKKFEEQYRKEMLKQVKLDRLMGTSDKVEEQLKNSDKVLRNTVKTIVLENPTMSAVDIVSILPLGFTDKELEEIIPDEEKRNKVYKVSKKIDKYIEAKDTKTKEDDKETKRDLDSEIIELTELDQEINVETTRETLVKIKEEKLKSREEKTNQNKEEEGKSTQEQDDLEH